MFISIIRKFIIDQFLFEDDGSLTEDTSFLGNGIIDSSGVLDLLTFIEDTFHIHVEDDELTRENLDSLRNINQFLIRKTAK